MKKRDWVLVICARIMMGEQLLIADNLIGKCDTCGHRVQYRPHAPKRRKLRCMECFAELVAPGDDIYTTSQMIVDAFAYFERKKH